VAAIETFKSWAEQTMRADVEALKAVVESESADLPARKLAASALSYLVSKMDLVPDWNAGIGFADDVMVLRIAAQLIQNHDTGELSTPASVALGRMSNEADTISEFLGTALFDKLRAYVAKLSEQEVRGRTPGVIVDDDAARARLSAEVDAELAKAGPVVLGDAAEAEVRLKAYLTHKLS
jgi:uncharacterized membrane protein YkvA (DUF1232 family)